MTVLRLIFLLSFLAPTWASAEAYRLQKTEIMDLAGDGGFKAMTILAPYGWRSDGGVFWNQRCAPYGYALNWRAIAPDRAEAISILPVVRWGLSRPGCPDDTFSTLSEVLQAQLRLVLKEITVLGYRQRPDLMSDALPDLSDGLMRSTFRPDAGELDFTALDADGKRVRGRILGRVIHTRTQTRDFAQNIMFDGRGGVTDPSFLYVATPEKFEPKILDVVRRSIVPDPTWARAMHKHHAETDRITFQGRKKLIEFQARFLKANSGLFSSFSQRDPNGRWLDRERTEAIRGVETFENSRGEEVQFDTAYPHAWDLGDGSFLITDNPAYDPNVGTTWQGVRMRRAP